MKNVFDRQSAEEIQERILRLRPDSARQWGSMSLTEALAHCTSSVQMAMGNIKPKRATLPLYLFGALYTPLFFAREIPFKRNSGTAPELLSALATPRDFETERSKLMSSLGTFIAMGPKVCTRHPHPFFGRLTPPRWATLIYRHLDHHLRQFAV